MAREPPIPRGQPWSAEDLRGYIRATRSFFYRGFLKLAVLRSLRERPMHGLDIIRRLEEVTGGDWVPSPGSVYPLLQEMEEDGLLARREEGRASIYSLTPFGESLLDALTQELRDQAGFIRWMARMSDLTTVGGDGREGGDPPDENAERTDG